MKHADIQSCAKVLIKLRAKEATQAFTFWGNGKHYLNKLGFDECTVIMNPCTIFASKSVFNLMVLIG